ncbi:phage antirepressor protein [Paracoccus yeei]|uniref:Phage antirepressor protein n=1 Tax=Paracoccus yeei TaxID=147645 RepID=A0A386UJ15_9RHOB|nr:phage regulatory protein/antirepressor Ant [Paracoccus yeei]AYF00466.1 phage antirepressor protein [Paracoccus yeei]AZV00472.1 DNA-binding protein [Paracoccus phage vB_PyeM_Pyei1]
MNMDQTPAPINLPVAAILSGEPLTMSSREIADLCEKRHDHVLRDIRAYVGAILQVERGIEVKSLDWTGKEGVQVFGETPIGGVTCVMETNRQNGQQYPVYHLDKSATLTVVSGYNVVLRKRIIDRWLELEGQGIPAMLTGPQLMAAALIEANATMQAQAQQIEAMSEDVAAHERLTKADGSLNVTEAAKNLGIRPKDLFDWLSHNGWIYKRPGSSSWLGYQPKCNQGLMEHKSTTITRADGSEKITEQVRITPKGLSVLAKLIFPTARLIGGAQ